MGIWVVRNVFVYCLKVGSALSISHICLKKKTEISCRSKHRHQEKATTSLFAEIRSSFFFPDVSLQGAKHIRVESVALTYRSASG